MFLQIDFIQSPVNGTPIELFNPLLDPNKLSVMSTLALNSYFDIFAHYQSELVRIINVLPGLCNAAERAAAMDRLIPVNKIVQSLSVEKLFRKQTGKYIGPENVKPAAAALFARFYRDSLVKAAEAGPTAYKDQILKLSVCQAVLSQSQQKAGNRVGAFNAA